MTITRNIDGKNVEIELTILELQTAYLEQEGKWDQEDTRERMANPRLAQACGYDPSKLTSNDIQEIAGLYRDSLDSEALYQTEMNALRGAITEYFADKKG